MRKEILLVLVVVSLALLGGCDDSPKAKQNIQPPSDPVKQEQQAVSGTQKTEVKPSEKNIPGIAAADIKLNLEKQGLKFTGPRPLKEDTGYLDDGKAKDPDTGVELSCTISAETPTKIRSVTFRADGSLLAGTISQDILLAIAEGFLGYCATLPYDEAEPVKAKAWVEENAGKVKTGQPIETTFGNVKYVLAGNEYFKLLTIKPESNPIDQQRE